MLLPTPISIITILQQYGYDANSGPKGLHADIGSLTGFRTSRHRAS